MGFFTKDVVLLIASSFLTPVLFGLAVWALKVRNQGATIGFALLGAILSGIKLLMVAMANSSVAQGTNANDLIVAAIGLIASTVIVAWLMHVSTPAITHGEGGRTLLTR